MVSVRNVGRYGRSGINKYDFLQSNFLKACEFADNEAITLLDAGCGIGSALHEIHNIYPNAILYGCDNDPDHYNECLRVHSHDATFILGDIRTMTDA